MLRSLPLLEEDVGLQSLPYALKRRPVRMSAKKRSPLAGFFERVVRRPTLSTILKEQLGELTDRTIASGNPPNQEEMERLQALQALTKLEQETRYRIDRWLILAGSILIAFVVSYLALVPYPVVRLYVTAKAKEIDFQARYQDIFQRLEISELKLFNTSLVVEDDGSAMTGDCVLSGGLIKPQLYTFFAKGTISVKYDPNERAHLVTVAGPSKDGKLFINAAGATLTGCQGQASPTVIKSRIILTGREYDSRVVAVAKKVDKSSPVSILSEEDIVDVNFVTILTFDKSNKYTFSPGSTIISGKLDFLNFPGKSYTLKPTEELSLDYVDSGRLRALDLLSDAVQITYNIAATDIRVGEFSNPASIMPSYLDYFGSRKGLGAMYAAAGSLISILIGVIGFFLRRGSSS
jgi:hypothetical protein